MSTARPEIECKMTVKDGLAVVVYMLCMFMIATISWYNYSTSSKLQHIIHDIQAKQIVGSGAQYVDFGRIESQVNITSAD